MAKYKIVIEFEIDDNPAVPVVYPPDIVPDRLMNDLVDSCAVQVESLSDGDISLSYPATLTSATWTRLP